MKCVSKKSLACISKRQVQILANKIKLLNVCVEVGTCKEALKPFLRECQSINQPHNTTAGRIGIMYEIDFPESEYSLLDKYGFGSRYGFCSGTSSGSLSRPKVGKLFQNVNVTVLIKLSHTKFLLSGTSLSLYLLQTISVL
jgi:hypothetical protein